MENFNFKKEFGQNFIFDGNLLSAIVFDAGITEKDNVLEIGAGAGTLTEKLSCKAKKVVAYEIDKNLTEHLNELAKKHNNLTIYMRDALKTPMKEIESDFNEGKYHVVANLPYYITSPLIFKFIENTKNVLSLTIMIQKEVAERYSARSNSKEYGIATIMLNYYADAKYVRTVNRKMFTPSPNVDSALIKITPNESKPKADDSKKFQKLVNASFSMRRKTLVNNLTKNFEANKEHLLSLIKDLQKSPSVRAEELEIKDFIYLSNNL